nr:hypothetical protein GCM10025699_19130 [Microbacterium flavescens]
MNEMRPKPRVSPDRGPLPHRPQLSRVFHRSSAPWLSAAPWAETPSVGNLALLRSSDLDERGMTPRRIRAELASGALVRLRPGVYASGSKWKASTPGQQVIARARALALISTTPPLFSHETAAALQGRRSTSPTGAECMSSPRSAGREERRA